MKAIDNIKNNIYIDKLVKHIHENSIECYTDTSLGYVKLDNQQLRFGKLLKNINRDDIPQSKLEKIVNQYKYNQLLEEGVEFEIWEDNDIKNAYDEDYYMDDISTLGNSCMNKGTLPETIKEDYLNLYKNNNIKVLVLLKEGLILGRALIFSDLKKYNTKLEFDTFMDRVYYIEDFILLFFKKYCLDNDWAYNYYNNNTKKKIFSYKGKKIKRTIKIEVKNKERFYPYLDTLSYSNKKIKYLTNKKKKTIFSNCSGYYSYKNKTHEVYVEDMTINIDIKPNLLNGSEIKVDIPFRIDDDLNKVIIIDVVDLSLSNNKDIFIILDKKFKKFRMAIGESYVSVKFL